MNKVVYISSRARQSSRGTNNFRLDNNLVVVDIYVETLILNYVHCASYNYRVDLHVISVNHVAVWILLVVPQIIFVSIG